VNEGRTEISGASLGRLRADDMTGTIATGRLKHNYFIHLIIYIMKKLTIKDIEKCSNEKFCVCTLNETGRVMHNFLVSKEAVIKEMRRTQMNYVEILTTLNDIISLKFF
jgi:hypothetical protein